MRLVFDSHEFTDSVDDTLNFFEKKLQERTVECASRVERSITGLRGVLNSDSKLNVVGNEFYVTVSTARPEHQKYGFVLNVVLKEGVLPSRKVNRAAYRLKAQLPLLCCGENDIQQMMLTTVSELAQDRQQWRKFLVRPAVGLEISDGIFYDLRNTGNSVLAVPEILRDD